jgi:hypothetical protein
MLATSEGQKKPAVHCEEVPDVLATAKQEPALQAEQDPAVGPEKKPTGQSMPVVAVPTGQYLPCAQFDAHEVWPVKVV